MGLDSGHPSRAEASPVAQTLDGELERHPGPTRAQKRGVQRVKMPARDRSSGGDHCLGEKKAAEEPFRASAGSSAEDVRADLLEIEAAKEARQRVRRLHAV
jgi:hypothetical protein